MASSHNGVVRLAGAFALLAGCNVSDGSGSADGVVSASECNLSPDAPFHLALDYFVTDPVNNDSDPTSSFIQLLLQHGGDTEERSDAITLTILHPTDVKTERLGQPLTVTFDGSDDVTMTLALNDTCPTSRDRKLTPVVYSAVSGTITFSEIYFPPVNDNKHTAAVFTDVRFEDPNHPADRFAILSGEFDFRYSRWAQHTTP